MTLVGPLFKSDSTYLPVTMSQFEELTNEILEKVNEVCAPNFLSGDYLAQILMSAIHALDHKHGRVNKSELFESCINRISCHVTFHASEEIRNRLAQKNANHEIVPDPDDPVSGSDLNSNQAPEPSLQ